MKSIIFSLSLFITSIVCHSQIVVQCKVKQAVSGKGIVANASYKSYPTGSITGTFKDSTFSFTIFGSSKYFISVKASEHIENGALIKPEDAKDGKMDVEIELVPKGGTIRLNHLIFDAGKDKIKPASFGELDGLVAMMKVNSKMEIQLEGHTDNKGNADANLKLSQARVDAVKKYLVDNDINKKRISTKAFGGTQPVATEDTEAARALNRRVEMRVLKD